MSTTNVAKPWVTVIVISSAEPKCTAEKRRQTEAEIDPLAVAEPGLIRFLRTLRDNGVPAYASVSVTMGFANRVNTGADALFAIFRRGKHDARD